MRRGRPRRPQKSTYKRKPRQFKVACNVCGAEYMVPVAPPAEKELTCLNCLQDTKEHNSGNEPGRQAPLPDDFSVKHKISDKAFKTRKRGSE